GHNGIRSIAAHIGPDFRRVRIGIGHPGIKERVMSHVLGDFAKADMGWVEPMLDAIADAAPLLAEGKDATFANKVHLALNPEPEKKQKTQDPKTKDSDGES
ncbi:MAG: aminoacyl-tRNA hydrolase, partial [Alphaproteobacteria bacterium HGW-Alphaproteobacteria-12]